MIESTIRRIRRPAASVIVAGVATVAAAAVGANALAPMTPVVSTGVAPVAYINPSNQTLGIADSDLYGLKPAQIDAHLDAMQALGVKNVRVLIPWAGVEPLDGTYNWATTDYIVNAADSRGMGILGILNSTPSWAVDASTGAKPISGRPASPAAYGDFAGLVAQRYKGKVGAYEIWNEPNAVTFYTPKPDPAGYTDLLKAAYPQIKAADAKATVVGGVFGAVLDYGSYSQSPTTFVKGIYAAGGKGYFDALSYHPYQYNKPFSQGIYATSPLKQLEAVRQLMVDNGDSTKKIWASEYGEPTSVASEDTQASYIKDFVNTYRGLSYTGPTFVYTLQDRDSTSTKDQDTLGIIRSDGTWKPAAYVVQQLATQQTTAGALARMALAQPDADTMSSATTASLVRQALDAAGLEAQKAPMTPGTAAMTAVAASVHAGATAAAAGVAAVAQAAATALKQMASAVDEPSTATATAGTARAESAKTETAKAAATRVAAKTESATAEAAAVKAAETTKAAASDTTTGSSGTTATAAGSKTGQSFADKQKARADAHATAAAAQKARHAKQAATQKVKHAKK